MPDPVTGIACAQDEWTAVATGVNGGKVITKDSNADYYATYRVEPVGTAPTADPQVEGHIIARVEPIYTKDGETHTIYIFCKNAAGVVQVDS